MFLIKRRRGEGWDLNIPERRLYRQDRESVTIRKLLGVREELNWRTSKMAKHSVVKKRDGVEKGYYKKKCITEEDK